MSLRVHAANRDIRESEGITMIDPSEYVTDFGNNSCHFCGGTKELEPFVFHAWIDSTRIGLAEFRGAICGQCICRGSKLLLAARAIGCWAFAVWFMLTVAFIVAMIFYGQRVFPLGGPLVIAFLVVIGYANLLGVILNRDRRCLSYCKNEWRHSGGYKYFDTGPVPADGVRAGLWRFIFRLWYLRSLALVLLMLVGAVVGALFLIGVLK